jgi:DNA-binding transcriptional regulator LsrR (DeoR family)
MERHPGETARDTPEERVVPLAGRFTTDQMHAAATLYYLQDATQADVATALGVSRATVSRLLSEARRQGIVRIEVVNPATSPTDELAEAVRGTLGLDRVHLAAAAHTSLLGPGLAPAVVEALSVADLRQDDVLLVSSGRTVWEVGNQHLPPLEGIRVAPTVGGQDEPEAWYQTNEITRRYAEQTGGRPTFLYAPAAPGEALHERLLEDPGIHRVLDLWATAKCALLGVGAPPQTRSSMPGFVPRDHAAVMSSAGDICTRFFDSAGREVAYPGSDRLIATSYEMLRAVPHSIAVAVGAQKVPSILAAAHAGWFNTLVTDVPTATALVAAAEG